MKTQKKQRITNLLLCLIFIAAIVLQFVGHAETGYLGLGIQMISLILLIIVLFIYNRRHS